ncbi:MAG: hypothetical protein HY815_33775, partial [Candidatus Riflebacteria bacterium]|nr:hypothetical protein [Candidatus Riflebacteria bacterium]
MMRAFAVMVLVTASLAGAALAESTAQWDAIYQNMTNKDRVSTWLAKDGDSLWSIVRSTYGVPDSKPRTMNAVIDAVIRYNNALRSSGQYDASKVTPIVDRNLILTGKEYFLPDPASLNRIMTDPNANIDQVVQESINSGSNRQIAQSGSGGAANPYTTGSVPDAT